MDTWSLLEKELEYFGVHLIDRTKCRIIDDSGKPQVKGVIRAVKDINSLAMHQKRVLANLWDEIIELLSQREGSGGIIDDKMIDLFVFSLKDLSKFLLCFDGADKSPYYKIVLNSLTQDIRTFSKKQIYQLPDYKICIDWVFRVISRLLYISKLLAFAAMGKKRISKIEIKTARGIAGPWSRLDIPMEERVFPFGTELEHREKGKQRQRRYTKGLENYNTPGVGEGHYWRELRNEPFSWFNRKTEDPYPHRSLLNG